MREPDNSTDGFAPEAEPDLSLAGEAAVWLLNIIASGVIGGVVYDALKSLYQSHGLSRVRELETRVMELIESNPKLKPGERDAMRKRASAIFSEYQ